AAAAAGAHVLPRARCQRLMWREGQVTGALVEDVLTGRAFVTRARGVVNAAGPFGDALLEPVASGQRLHLSRGSHLLLPAERLPLRETVVLFSPRDRRALFASPRAGHVLVGTTEVAHRGPAIDPVPSADE